jgi:1-pyrroline-5-carboxylate dehydrogenase
MSNLWGGLQVAIVAEQLLRLLHHCGMPKKDVDFMVGPGLTMNEIINQAQPRNTLFTGSQRVAEKLAADTNGKVSENKPLQNCIDD